MATLESVFSESRLAGGACVSACHASDFFFFLLSQEVKCLVTRMQDEQPVNGLESAGEKEIDRSLSARVI